MIRIKVDHNYPEFYGATGLHLYEVKPKLTGEDKEIVLDAKSKAIDLYKLYHDIVIFLSDEVNPFPDETNIGTYVVFGNPNNMGLIENPMDDDGGHQIVGYLNTTDALKVSAFLSEKGFEDKINVQKHYNSLKPEVKEQLTMLLDDQIVDELHPYLRDIVTFFSAVTQNKSEVVILVNG